MQWTPTGPSPSPGGSFLAANSMCATTDFVNNAQTRKFVTLRNHGVHGDHGGRGRPGPRARLLLSEHVLPRAFLAASTLTFTVISPSPRRSLLNFDLYPAPRRRATS